MSAHSSHAMLVSVVFLFLHVFFALARFLGIIVHSRVTLPIDFCLRRLSFSSPSFFFCVFFGIKKNGARKGVKHINLTGRIRKTEENPI